MLIYIFARKCQTINTIFILYLVFKHMSVKGRTSAQLPTYMNELKQCIQSSLGPGEWTRRIKDSNTVVQLIVDS